MKEESNFNSGAEIIDSYINSGKVRLSAMVEELLSRENFRSEPRLRDYFRERVMEEGLVYNRAAGVYELPK